LGYGGLLLEYLSNPDSLIHYNISGLIGGGGVNYGYRNMDFYYGEHFGNSSFFVLEPAAEVGLNITSFFRLSAGVSCRWIKGSSIVGMTGTDLSCISSFNAFKLGKL